MSFYTPAFDGEPTIWSYVSGCSTVGYQGLSESQRYPDDFDGIISCAPGNNRTNLTLAFLWNYLANHRPGDDRRQILSNDDLRFLNRKVVAACDTIDGVADGRSEEHTSELQSLMRNSYAVFCLKKKQ